MGYHVSVFFLTFPETEPCSYVTEYGILNMGGDSETLKELMTPKCLKAFRCFSSVIAI